MVNNRNFSLVEIKATGAFRHQVRAHLASLGFPLVGDRVYGSRSALKDLNLFAAEGFLLHAEGIRFNHPLLKQNIQLNCGSQLIDNLL